MNLEVINMLNEISAMGLMEGFFRLMQFALIGLVVYAYIRLFTRGFGSLVGPVKSAKAKVIDKNIWYTTGEKAKGYKKKPNYVIVFSIENGKKKSFYVSELSYQGYHVGESGTLKYRGDRIIEFT